MSKRVWGILTTIVSLVFMISWVSMSSLLQKDSLKQTQLQIEKRGLIVQEGIVESPSVLLSIGKLQEFLEQCAKLNATTIYQQGNTFYVFNENMTIAWGLQVGLFYSILGLAGLFGLIPFAIGLWHID